MSTSALSHSVAGLEARLGVRLFNRTTRSVSTSEAGERFIASIAPALSTIRAAMDQAASEPGKPTGTLRINAAGGAVSRTMALFIEFMQLYPDIKLDIVTDGRLIDIVAAGFDAGIRSADTLPQDMIAVPFGRPLKFTVVGSPAYFTRFPKPLAPLHLGEHQCIRVRMPSGSIYRWEFTRGGESVEVDVQGMLTLDQPNTMLDAARAGLGLAYLAEWYVAEDLASGRLESVLDDWIPAHDRLCLYYPGRRHVPPGLAALIALIRERQAVDPVSA
jgi:DNA-binding transcriptional LysR family regulator